MAFIPKNPLSIPEIAYNPSTLPGTRGIFAKEDGWYEIDSKGNVEKICTFSDITKEIKYLTSYFKTIPEGMTINDLEGVDFTGCYILFNPEHGGYTGLLYVNFGTYSDNEAQTDIPCTYQTRYIHNSFSDGSKHTVKIETRNNAYGWSEWEDLFVDKVDDKGLSTEDYTTSEKESVKYLSSYFKQIPDGMTIDDLTEPGTYIGYENAYHNSSSYIMPFILFVSNHNSMDEFDYAKTCQMRIYCNLLSEIGDNIMQCRLYENNGWTAWKTIYATQNDIETEIKKLDYLTSFFKSIPQEARDESDYIDTMTYENGYAGVYLIGKPYIDHVRGCDMLYICEGSHPTKDTGTTYQMKFSLFRGYDGGGNLLPDRFHFKQRYQEINEQGDFDGWSEWEELFKGGEIIYPELFGTVDLEYNPESANAQSGIAVAEAISSASVEAKVYVDSEIAKIPTGGGGETWELLQSHEVTEEDSELSELKITFPEGYKEYVVSLERTAPTASSNTIIYPYAKKAGGGTEATAFWDSYEGTKESHYELRFSSMELNTDNYIKLEGYTYAVNQPVKGKPQLMRTSGWINIGTYGNKVSSWHSVTFNTKLNVGSKYKVWGCK